MRRWVAAGLLLAGSACKFTAGPTPGDPGGGTGGEGPPLARKGLPVGDCDGAGGVLELSGGWVFRFETVSTVEGALPQAQPETVTRYGVARICQDGTAVTAWLLVCSLAQTPLRDDAGDCAAQHPSEALLRALPAVVIAGELDRDAPGARLRFPIWRETWGLASPDAALPAETDAAAEDPVVADQDGDGNPGVTLAGTGEVPTLSWAVRRTDASFDLEIRDAVILIGTTQSETDQRIVGGPAARVVRGRRREGAAGEALFVRADGLFRSPRADADADGVLTCGELGPFLFDVLPPPPPDACPR